MRSVILSLVDIFYYETSYPGVPSAKKDINVIDIMYRKKCDGIADLQEVT